MTCVKTGCHIYLEPYGEYAYGDAFEIEPILPEDHKLWYKIGKEDALKIKNTAYFNLVARSREPINGMDHIHYVVHDWDNWFNQGLGASPTETLRASILITNNFTRETRKI